MPESWEQLPGEGAEAFAAFEIYRDLGPRRTLNQSYRTHFQQKGVEGGTKASGTWRRWFRNYRWSDRAMVWDARGRQIALNAHDEVIHHEATSKARLSLLADRRVEQEDEEWELRGLLIQQAREMLRAELFKKRIKNTGPDGSVHVVEIMPAKWSKSTAVQMLEVATKLGRASARMPLRVDDIEAPATFDELFYSTSGQAEQKLPVGAVPTMPAETHVKPDFDVRGDDGRDDRPPTQPPITRP